MNRTDRDFNDKEERSDLFRDGKKNKRAEVPPSFARSPREWSNDREAVLADIKSPKKPDPDPVS